MFGLRGGLREGTVDPQLLYPQLSTKLAPCIHSRRRTYIADAQLI